MRQTNRRGSSSCWQADGVCVNGVPNACGYRPAPNGVYPCNGTCGCFLDRGEVCCGSGTRGWCCPNGATCCGAGTAPVSLAAPIPMVQFLLPARLPGRRADMSLTKLAGVQGQPRQSRSAKALTGADRRTPETRARDTHVTRPGEPIGGQLPRETRMEAGSHRRGREASATQGLGSRSRL
jgi:hypothetical protein